MSTLRDLSNYMQEPSSSTDWWPVDVSFGVSPFWQLSCLFNIRPQREKTASECLHEDKQASWQGTQDKLDHIVKLVLFYINDYTEYSLYHNMKYKWQCFFQTNYLSFIASGRYDKCQVELPRTVTLQSSKAIRSNPHPNKFILLDRTCKVIRDRCYMDHMQNLQTSTVWW